MNSILVVLMLVIMIPVFITLMFMPYLTRLTESFGVTIPEDIYHSARLKLMRKQYALITGILSASVLVIFMLFSSSFGDNEATISLIFGSALVTFMASSFLVYLFFHRKMESLKIKEGWAGKKPQTVVIDTRFREQKLTHSNLWFILSFVVVIATIILTFLQYNQIPDRIPTRYNFEGDITNWADKSYRTVLLIPIMQVYLTLLFLFINTMITKAKQQVSVERPEDSIRQNVIFRRAWSLFIIITGTALTLLFSFIQLSFIYPINQQALVIVPLVFSFGVTIYSIVLSFTTGQGGSRLKTQAGKNGNVIDRDDDKYWKFGQVYFNKNDPSLFLEKRFGIGWTINYARPVALLILLGIVLLAISLPMLLGA
ncbi:DUF1648 domain-containing protein [Bacillus sp. DJP31]|uniref:DUF1648 domain-containing protein n=1 Tax=Bacillus sp. DJP31 TaxID=3409789 RepID=UPI003BB7C6A6